MSAADCSFFHIQFLEQQDKNNSFLLNNHPNSVIMVMYHIIREFLKSDRYVNEVVWF